MRSPRVELERALAACAAAPSGDHVVLERAARRVLSFCKRAQRPARALLDIALAEERDIMEDRVAGRSAPYPRRVATADTARALAYAVRECTDRSVVLLEYRADRGWLQPEAHFRTTCSLLRAFASPLHSKARDWILSRMVLGGQREL